MTTDLNQSERKRVVVVGGGFGGLQVAKSLKRSNVQLTLIDRRNFHLLADLSIKGHPDIFVIGDLAHCNDAKGKPLPGVAQVAIQQGRYVGKLMAHQVQGKTKLDSFRYKDKGSLATIGRSAAVADLGGHLKFSGFFAWMLWLLVHIMSITAFQNRVLVLLQWAWNYITFNRSARLITESARLQKETNQT